MFAGAGLGAVARTFIRPYTWLGEYEGDIYPPGAYDDGDDDDEDGGDYSDDGGDDDDSDVDDAMFMSYAHPMTRDGMLLYLIDAERLETSNWLRWLNCPRTRREENVRSVQCNGKMFFVTTKWVIPGQELLVYYGDWYAKNMLGIDTEQFKL